MPEQRKMISSGGLAKILGKSERTIKRYADLLSTFISGMDRRLHELTAFDIRLYLSMYKEKRKVKNRTLDNMRKVLSSFFSWLHDEEFIQRNPCRAVKSIKYDKLYFMNVHNNLEYFP